MTLPRRNTQWDLPFQWKKTRRKFNDDLEIITTLNKTENDVPVKKH